MDRPSNEGGSILLLEDDLCQLERPLSQVTEVLTTLAPADQNLIDTRAALRLNSSTIYPDV